MTDDTDARLAAFALRTLGPYADGRWNTRPDGDIRTFVALCRCHHLGWIEYAPVKGDTPGKPSPVWFRITHAGRAAFEAAFAANCDRREAQARAAMVHELGELPDVPGGSFARGAAVSLVLYLAAFVAWGLCWILVSGLPLAIAMTLAAAGIMVALARRLTGNPAGGQASRRRPFLRQEAEHPAGGRA